MEEEKPTIWSKMKTFISVTSLILNVILVTILFMFSSCTFNSFSLANTNGRSVDAVDSAENLDVKPTINPTISPTVSIP